MVQININDLFDAKTFMSAAKEEIIMVLTMTQEKKVRIPMPLRWLQIALEGVQWVLWDR